MLSLHGDGESLGVWQGKELEGRARNQQGVCRWHQVARGRGKQGLENTARGIFKLYVTQVILFFPLLFQN